jgi:cytochrome P450
MSTSTAGIRVRTPGPSGIGYLPGFVRDPARALTDLRRQYGDVVHVRHGPLRGYLVFHPVDVERVLGDNVANYGHGDWVNSKMASTLGRGIFTVDGAEWRRQRHTLGAVFDHSDPSAFGEQVVERSRAACAAWAAAAGRGESLDMREAMERLSVANAGQFLFGDDWAANAEILSTARRVFVTEAGRRLSSPIGRIPLSVPLPFHRTFRRVRHRYDQCIDRLIDRRRAAPTDEDLLGRLIRSHDAQQAAGPSDDELLRNQVTTVFVLAAPVPITLTWVAHLLAAHPEVAKRLRSELTVVLGDRAVGMADLPRLPFLQQVVDEALRMYPPIFLQPREALQADVLSGHAIPAGTRVVLCPYVTQRHEGCWVDPDRFDPDRFSPERSVGRAAYAFFPMGQPGPRRCLGSDLGRLELALVVATVAQHFQLSLTGSGRPETVMRMAMDFAGPVEIGLRPSDSD